MRGTISNFLRQYAFMLAFAAMFIGFSAFKTSSALNADDPFLYALDEHGNIGQRLDEAEADCNRPSGEYCYVELTEEKPANVTTLTEAINANIHSQTFYWD